MDEATIIDLSSDDTRETIEDEVVIDDGRELIMNKYNWDQPLAEIIRPKTLKDYIGQSHLLDSHGEINNFINVGYLPSMILYGPPGVGKTTLASILANETNYVFVEMSATDGTIEDLKNLETTIKTENNKRFRNNRDYLSVVVFIDEIHRFKINQQDYLLPLIESGIFVFIGATTMNPSTRLRKAIISRCQIYQLKSLDNQDLMNVLNRAIIFENIRRRLKSFNFLHYENDIKDLLITKCQGDSRKLINFIEIISLNYETNVTKDQSSLNVQESDVLRILNHLSLTNYDPLSYSNENFKDLFDSIRNVKFKQEKLYLALQTKEDDLQQPKINDQNDLFLQNDVNYSILPSDNLSSYNYASQMEFSDNEDLNDSQYREIYYHPKTNIRFNNVLSDSESDYEPINTKSSDGRAQVVKCLSKLLILINNRVPPEIIIKKLLLFNILYINDNSSIFKIMGLLKAIQTVNINVTKSLSNLVERMAKLRKTDFPLHNFKHAKTFLNRQKRTCTMSTPEISFDDDEVKRLLQVPSPDQTLQSSVIIHTVDTSDPDINIGTQFGNMSPIIPSSITD